MGAVVNVRVTAASRWNVTGDVVSVIYQPPGSPPIRCTPALHPSITGGIQGEVHPLLHSPPPALDIENPAAAAGTEQSASSAAQRTSSSDGGDEDSAATACSAGVGLQDEGQGFALLDAPSSAVAEDIQDRAAESRSGGAAPFRNTLQLEQDAGCSNSRAEQSECSCGADTCCQQDTTAVSTVTDSAMGSPLGHTRSSEKANEAAEPDEANEAHAEPSNSRADDSRQSRENRTALQHKSVQALPATASSVVGLECAENSPTHSSTATACSIGVAQQTSSPGDSTVGDLAFREWEGWQDRSAGSKAAAEEPDMQPAGAVPCGHDALASEGAGAAAGRSIKPSSVAIASHELRSRSAQRRLEAEAAKPVLLARRNGEGSSAESVTRRGSTGQAQQAVEAVLSAGILLVLSGVLITGVTLLLSS